MRFIKSQINNVYFWSSRHKSYQTIHHIRNITKSFLCLSITINNQISTFDSIQNKIWKQKTITQSHTRSISSKDTSNLSIYSIDLFISLDTSLSESLTLIVTTTRRHVINNTLIIF